MRVVSNYTHLFVILLHCHILYAFKGLVKFSVSKILDVEKIPKSPRISPRSYCHDVNSNKFNNSKEYIEHVIDIKQVNETIVAWTRPLPSEYLQRPLVLAGPSGVGKNRLIRALLKDYTRFFRRVVTHTTRSPRPGEVNGTHYYFVTKDQYQSMKDAGKFLENAEVHNNLYGTSLESFTSGNCLLSSRIAFLKNAQTVLTVLTIDNTHSSNVLL